MLLRSSEQGLLVVFKVFMMTNVFLSLGVHHSSDLVNLIASRLEMPLQLSQMTVA